jgi:hypothetical protein
MDDAERVDTYMESWLAQNPPPQFGDRALRLFARAFGPGLDESSAGKPQLPRRRTVHRQARRVYGLRVSRRA